MRLQQTIIIIWPDNTAKFCIETGFEFWKGHLIGFELDFEIKLLGWTQIWKT